jgi:hypothetical protein
MHVATNQFHKNIMSIAYVPRGMCYARNNTPPLLGACKVFLSCMQKLKNYDGYLCCLLQCACHTPHAHVCGIAKNATGIMHP